MKEVLTYEEINICQGFCASKQPQYWLCLRWSWMKTRRGCSLLRALDVGYCLLKRAEEHIIRFLTMRCRCMGGMLGQTIGGWVSTNMTGCRMLRFLKSMSYTANKTKCFRLRRYDCSRNTFWVKTESLISCRSQKSFC